MDIAIVAGFAFISELAAHYFPWRLLLGRELGRVPAYIIGMLLIALPFSALLITHAAWRMLVGLWAVIVAGGLAVMLAYALDGYLAAHARAREAEEREAYLHDQAIH